MKNLFTIAAILLSTSLFAGNENKNLSDAEKATVLTNIAGLIGDETVLNELGINGQADVTVVVDENGVMHVEEVQSTDYLLEYHIRQSIDGAKMIVNESLVGKTVSFIMNVVQSK
ncbi:MAG: hypothetical protein IPL12_19345 [Bacteroidetes bacterium]|nr:hypothetical protein [Bacteroidota bacterium]MBK8345240.1 hypothetical protein [Bacteroidota bacterium]